MELQSSEVECGEQLYIAVLEVQLSVPRPIKVMFSSLAVLVLIKDPLFLGNCDNERLLAYQLGI